MASEANHVLLTEQNRKDFESVFPAAFREADNRISIGAYREDGAVLGAISFVLVDNQYDIDWLYVEAEVRRQGIATGLIRVFQDFILKTGERYPVNVRFPVTQEDVSLHRFFLSLPGADVTYSHERYFISPEDIRKSNPIHRRPTETVEVKSFFSTDDSWQQRTLQSIQRVYGFAVSNEEAWKEDCVPELCLYMSVKNNVLCGIFVQRATEHMLDLVFLYGKYPPGMFQVLGEAVDTAERLFPEDDLTFEAINEKSEKLAQHLFPKARSVSIYEAGW